MGVTASVIAGILLTMAPLPWAVGSLLGAVAGIVFGAVGSRRARRLPGGQPAASTLRVGAAFSAFVLIYASLLAVQWPAQWEYQQCQAHALTHEAADSCLAEYRDNSVNLIQRLTGDQ
jgi:hypothetical protein